MPAKLKVLPGGEEKLIDVGSGITVKELLKKLGLSPESYVVTKNGEVVVEDEIISDGDVIEVYRVVSGG